LLDKDYKINKILAGYKMVYNFLVLNHMYIYRLNFYFFQENFAGSKTPPAKALVRRAGQNGYLLFKAGTGFVLRGFSGRLI
jgi:hypothetical protein